MLSNSPSLLPQIQKMVEQVILPSYILTYEDFHQIKAPLINNFRVQQGAEFDRQKKGEALIYRLSLKCWIRNGDELVWLLSASKDPRVTSSWTSVCSSAIKMEVPICLANWATNHKLTRMTKRIPRSWPRTCSITVVLTESSQFVCSPSLL